MNHPFPADAHERWRHIRAGGKGRYVFQRWFLPLAVPLSVVWALAAMALQAMRNNHPVSPIVFTDTPRLIFYLILGFFFSGGIFVVLAGGRWAKNERRFLAGEKNHDA